MVEDVMDHMVVKKRGDLTQLFETRKNNETPRYSNLLEVLQQIKKSSQYWK